MSIWFSTTRNVEILTTNLRIDWWKLMVLNKLRLSLKKEFTLRFVDSFFLDLHFLFLVSNRYLYKDLYIETLYK